MGPIKVVKEHLGIVFAVAQGILQTMYWISALIIAGHMFGGLYEAYWGSTPGGSFFPWPTPPGPFMAICPAGPWDRFFYFLIRSWAFIPLAVGLIALTGYFGRLIAKI
ncbi:MAG: hypothetical protein ACFFBS_10160 [Promethearchaeota archaeon]